MLTKDLNISTPEYWDKFYSGKNDGPVDSSKNVRTATFNRFQWMVDYITEGESFLDVAAGHAHVCKLLRSKFPNAKIVACDQSEEAKKVAGFMPYEICSAYNLPWAYKAFDVVICSQAMEYMSMPGQFLDEASRVGNNLLVTVPKGEMKKWSQLRLYDEEKLRTILAEYGTVTAFETHDDLMLAKVQCND